LGLDLTSRPSDRNFTRAERATAAAHRDRVSVVIAASRLSTPFVRRNA
jgi:hypothetical protein